MMVGDSDLAPWPGWIDTSRVLELHELSLAEYGGAPGPHDPSGCVDAAIGGAQSAEVYLEGKPRAKAGLTFAAYALFYIVQRHCFTDGNKRTAWLAAVDILGALGLGIQASDDEAFDLMHRVIAHEVATGDDVAAWMASRLFALD